ncbi:hypothetical protein CKAN_01954100 [Cinnamomum micranthum f. kanehirae]|uniref:Uncharacterized protein n=1 Tax=Cinnamomum micranthum f. kanehirae TaxID=337451 RepID=A0A443PI36_9MAGN|nr:hypothetical protein CKAN_01954100 [Cinnamomum micranthum f. kanehirae]
MGAINYQNNVASVKSTSHSTSPFTIAVGFLLFNTVGAVLRIRDDILALTFTISFSIFLMIFFWCVSVFDKLPPGSKKRDMMKVPIWLLGTTLNLMFAYRVRTIIQPGMALEWLVWGMGGITSLITFYFFFLYGDKRTTSRQLDSEGFMCPTNLGSLLFSVVSENLFLFSSLGTRNFTKELCRLKSAISDYTSDDGDDSAMKT